MSMVEQMARAICEARLWPGAWQLANDVERAACLRDARAALAAQRTPTPGIYLRAVATTGLNIGVVHSAFAEVIDAALTEGEDNHADG